MKVTANRNRVIQLLEAVADLSEAESSVNPVMSCVRLASEGGRLHAATNSLEGTAMASDECAGDDGLVAAVNMKRAQGGIVTLYGDTLTMELGEGRLILRGESGSMRIPTISEPDVVLDGWRNFTEPETAATLEVDAGLLLSAIKAVEHAKAKDGVHAALAGVCLDASPQGAVAVATDGRRLAMHPIKGAGADREVSVTLGTKPAQAVKAALARLSGAVSLTVDAQFLLFRSANLSLRVSGVSLAFAKWRNVVAGFSAEHASAVVATDKLQAALKRALVVDAPALLTLNGQQLDILATDGEKGTADGTVPATEVQGEGAMSVKARQVLDALEACGGEKVRLGYIVVGTSNVLSLRPTVGDLQCYAVEQKI